ncbi:hypothetical protein DPMN_044878 [Dreissena polymorpha]|uniref:Uncharacterized protein n=1 Tax=Dreissena polymorpha TaxID=45954 RepID=A0A9D4HZ75_DREPO|nr:hypothetical protein DPMN_044878 [Dreissena polymorpha]
MNLLCSPLHSTFTKNKLTHLMHTCIKGLDLNDKTLEELCDAFKNRMQRKLCCNLCD